jgi:hypothetical protein
LVGRLFARFRLQQVDLLPAFLCMADSTSTIPLDEVKTNGQSASETADRGDIYRSGQPSCRILPGIMA